MKITEARSDRSEAGFSLLELMLVVAIMTIVLGAVFNGMDQVTKRSQVEQTKVDLTQAGREFVDEFERDVHQAGYPNCRMVATAGVASNCSDSTNRFPTTVTANTTLALGLVHVDSTLVIFEGDVDGSGTVSQVWYQLVDSAGHYPPSGTCPCKLQRAQIRKVATTDAGFPLPNLATSAFSLELQNVVNSGQSTTLGVYSGGLQISGNTAWGESNDAYYAAVSAFKDFPVFQGYDQYGQIVQLPQDLGTAGNLLNCTPTFNGCIKTIRLTINLLANGLTGVDLQNKVRPVTTLVGDARLVNN
jgi:prepilin-type N-terminal cleavage/methylation domain-containing protein